MSFSISLVRLASVDAISRPNEPSNVENGKKNMFDNKNHECASAINSYQPLHPRSKIRRLHCPYKETWDFSIYETLCPNIHVMRFPKRQRQKYSLKTKLLLTLSANIRYNEKITLEVTERERERDPCLVWCILTPL